MKAPWLKDAIIGIKTAPQLHIEGDMGELIAKVLTQPIEPALAFAQSIGVWAVCRKAAVMPSFIQGEQTLEKDCAAVEKTMSADHPVLKALIQLLEKANFRLLAEVFNLMQQKELRLPTQLLPLALDTGKRSVELRLSLSHVLGTRGIWLAHQNPAWRYAASDISENADEDDIRLWEEGTQTQREAFFKNCRTKTPDQARELLSSELHQLPAKERLQFVEIMETNLSLNDEDFLTSLLKDRSREVKEKASALLGQLPQSGYAQKIISYMQELLVKEKGLIKTSWKCTPPQEFNPEWAELGLTKDVPSSYRVGGERSWWFIQLIRKTPLAWWQTYTGMTPKDLLQWSKKTDWQKELQQGWIENLSCQDFDWIILLFQQPSYAKMGNYHIQSKLQQVLPQLSFEKLRTLFEQLPDNVLSYPQTLNTLINGLPFGQTLPEDFSQRICKLLKENYNKKQTREDYRIRYFFQEAAHMLSPNVLKTYKPISPAPDQSEEQWVQEIEQIIEIRQTLHNSFDRSAT